MKKKIAVIGANGNYKTGGETLLVNSEGNSVISYADYAIAMGVIKQTLPKIGSSSGVLLPAFGFYATVSSCKLEQNFLSPFTFSSVCKFLKKPAR